MRRPNNQPDFSKETTINAPRPFVWDSILEKWNELREEDESLGELYKGLAIRKNLATFSLAAMVTNFEENEDITFAMDRGKSTLVPPLSLLKSAELSLMLHDQPAERTRVAVMGNVALSGGFLGNIAKNSIRSLVEPKIADGLSELRYYVEASWSQQQGERAS